MKIMLQPGERVLRIGEPLANLIIMGAMLDDIDIWWPLPEALSFTNSLSTEIHTRQFG